MKTMIRYTALSVLAILAFAGLGFGQSNGKISGKVTNQGSDEINRKVYLLENGSRIKGVMTDFEGFYEISQVEPGTYSLEFLLLDTTLVIKNLTISVGESVKQDLRYREVVIGGGDIVYNYNPVPFTVDPVQPVTYTPETMKETRIRNPMDVVAMSGKVTQRDQGDPLNFGGGRATSNQTYVDGVKMVGEIALPVEAIGQISFLSGGIPAEYGDATGGIVVISTRNPGMKPWVGPAREKKVKTKKEKKTGAEDAPVEIAPLG